MGAFQPGTGKPIQLGDFAPDLPHNTPGVILDADGAFATVAGFRPLPKLIPIGDALPARPAGSYLAYYSDETIRLFAATDNTSVGGLGVTFYQLDPATGHWLPVLGPSIATPVPIYFVNFGDDILVAGNFDHIYRAANKGVNFSAIATSPANAKSIASVNLQALAFAGATWNSSAVGDDTDFVPNLATLAASGIFYDSPGPVVAACPFNRNMIAFKKNCCYKGTQGFPNGWDWDLISTQTGTWGQGCVVQLPNAVAFVGMDDFYLTSGFTPERIPNNCAKWFFDTVDPVHLDKIQGWFDEGSSTIYWHFPSRQAQQPPVCDMYIAYNQRARKWFPGHLGVSSVPYIGLAPGAIPHPLRDKMPGFGEGEFGGPLPNYGSLTDLSSGANIIFDDHWKPMAFAGFAGAMSLTTGFVGSGASMVELMRCRAIYNEAPNGETLTALHANEMHKGEQAKSAQRGADGWHNVRAQNRWVRVILGTQDDCEVTGFIFEIRPAGQR